MKHTKLRLLLSPVLVFGMLIAQRCAGQQTGSPATAVAGAPRAIDPLFVKPADQLTTEQVALLQKKLADWPQLSTFRDDNAKLAPAGPDRVVFFGDSITIAWKTRDNNVFFPGKPYVNRGISGQTTAQMLVRFPQDVVALRPAVVVILGGINDLAGNAGEITPRMMADNYAAMVQLAHANGIRVVLSSVLPAIDIPWRPGLHPADKVREVNAWLRRYAAAQRCVYLDYYTPLADKDGGMKPGLSKDNVHPTPTGYAVMAPLAEGAIHEAFGLPKP